MSEIPNKEKNKITVYLYWLIRGVIVVAFVGFLINGNWLDAVLTALIFVLMLVPSFLKDRYKIYIPFEFDLATTIFIFLTLFLGSLRDFYEKFTWWDVLLHSQSGILLGIVGFLLVYILNEESHSKITLSPVFVAFFSFCFSLALGALWEIYEFLGDTWFGFNMQRNGLPDTMEDLIINALGALIISVLGYIWIRRSKKLPFVPN